MSTTPVPPVPPMGPGGDPDDNPDLVDPGTENPDIGTRPGDDSPLIEPVPKPGPDEENPDDQLPHWED